MRHTLMAAMVLGGPCLVWLWGCEHAPPEADPGGEANGAAVDPVGDADAAAAAAAAAAVLVVPEIGEAPAVAGGHRRSDEIERRYQGWVAFMNEAEAYTAQLDARQAGILVLPEVAGGLSAGGNFRVAAWGGVPTWSAGGVRDALYLSGRDQVRVMLAPYAVPAERRWEPEVFVEGGLLSVRLDPSGIVELDVPAPAGSGDGEREQAVRPAGEE